MNDAYSGQRYDAQGPDGRDPYGRDPYDPQAPYGQQGYATGQQPGYQQTYDADGRPVYPAGGQPAYDTGAYPAYDTGTYPTHGGLPQQDQGYGQQGYATGQPGYQHPGHQQAYDTGAYPAYDTGTYPAYGGGQPGHQQPAQYAPRTATETGEWQAVPQSAQAPHVPQQPSAPEREYHTEQFAFVEEETEQAEDAIDWLKFTESRTERREEAKRRGRSRRSMLVVLLCLALLGSTGYLWYADKLPFLAGPAGSDAAEAGVKRDVIVVHLKPLRSSDSATALLVDNETTGRATTVLLPGNLAVTTDDGGSTTLAKSVEDEAAGATRDAVDSVLGSQIKGTWRLDAPFLELLVEGVGGLTLDATATVPGAKKGAKPLVVKGKDRELNGAAAAAYASYRAAGESPDAPLERFGAVLQALLEKLPSDKEGVGQIVKSMGAIADPSLSEGELAASLAALSTRAKEGDYATRMLPVRQDGTLDEKASEKVVKDILGGTVKNADPGATAKVAVRNASGDKARASSAQVALVNGGYNFAGASAAEKAQPASQVLYSDASRAEAAQEVAKTLGLGAKAVKKGTGAAGADITVVLGQDYKG
ncbi:LytR C-terminal domain-containing protein [Streptomyces polyrhachis]|uniref:LytR C-terminal domain-containing protein n=1 Tax=Streptomyces polyrhachis TaxID=1282885 RepID=A0ABW2GI70_9ACTN